MTIRAVREARPARALAETILAAQGDALPGDGSLPQVGVLPVYGMTLQHLAARRFRKAYRQGWAYFAIADAERGGVVQIAHRTGEAPEFRRYTRGGTADRIAAAAIAADRRFGRSRHEFRPRLLRIPALGISTLWLSPAESGEQDIFIALESAHIDRYFAVRMAGAARTRLSAARAERALFE